MTCLSKPDIFYITVKASYRKNKRDVSVETWIVSSFDDPIDIMLYDDKTMSRLRKLFYKTSKAKDKRVSIDEILDRKVIGKSQRSLDDQKGTDSSGD